MIPYILEVIFPHKSPSQKGHGLMNPQDRSYGKSKGSKGKGKSSSYDDYGTWVRNILVSKSDTFFLILFWSLMRFKWYDWRLLFFNDRLEYVLLYLSHFYIRVYCFWSLHEGNYLNTSLESWLCNCSCMCTAHWDFQKFLGTCCMGMRQRQEQWQGQQGQRLAVYHGVGRGKHPVVTRLQSGSC